MTQDPGAKKMIEQCMKSINTFMHFYVVFYDFYVTIHIQKFRCSAS